MTYPYNAQNLLENPHKYYYSPFQGVTLIQSYLKSRQDILSLHQEERKQNTENLTGFILVKKTFTVIEKIIAGQSPNVAEDFCRQLREHLENHCKPGSEDDLQLAQMTEALKKISPNEFVTTSSLLNGLVASLLAEKTDSEKKIWLDRLVQRFEVTKKIYEVYLPGFRKGQGDNKSIILYWLLSLALCLEYSKTKNLKYLNCLVKINDLLTSLPSEDLHEVIPAFGLELVLSTEVVSVSMLVEDKGVDYASE